MRKVRDDAYKAISRHTESGYAVFTKIADEYEIVCKHHARDGQFANHRRCSESDLIAYVDVVDCL